MIIEYKYKNESGEPINKINLNCLIILMAQKIQIMKEEDIKLIQSLIKIILIMQKWIFILNNYYIQI